MRLLLAIMLYLTFLHATTLYGDIYEAENFELLNNTVLKVEGPRNLQQIVDGNYTLVLPEGEYRLIASHYQAGTLKYYSEDRIVVQGEEMRFDIILLPSELQDIYDVEVGDLPAADEEMPAEDNLFPLIIGLIILVAIAAYLLARRQRKTTAPKEEKGEEAPEEIRPEELDEDAKKVLKILKEQEGRMMQQELRKILDFSETKMSLLMAELEVGGHIKRIKRGRQNIVKLKK
ncbi:MAG TPA: hypothetical protein VJH24_05720 [Candidatus Bilamarchaeaceae archaeon]|nr:hypothetical protein [Candidatus Bilamarchaeaceae archaeon]